MASQSPSPPGDTLDAGRADARHHLRPPHRPASHHPACLHPYWLGPRRHAEQQHLVDNHNRIPPLKRTASPTDTVEVTDPTHPFYGLTFPLLGITTKPRLGRVCVVGLSPGVERVIPSTATNLGGTPAAPAPCRLSVAGLPTLFAVVAMGASSPQEAAHVDAPCPDDFPQPSAGLPMVRGDSLPLSPPPRSRPDCPTTAMGDAVYRAADTNASDDPAHSTESTV